MDFGVVETLMQILLNKLCEFMRANELIELYQCGWAAGKSSFFENK